MSPWLLWIATTAWAQTLDDPAIMVPGASVADEAGPGSLWVNPSVLAYDPDPRWGLVFGHHIGDRDGLDLGFTGGIGGLGAGLRYARGANDRGDWAVDLAASVPLPRRIAVGAALRWRLPATAPNFVSFDAAVSWRPLPFLGATVATRNIGNPGGNDIAPPQTSIGVVVRPAGPRITIGTDFTYTMMDGGASEPHFGASARWRVRRGLYLRGRAETTGRVGAGFEVYFGGSGTGGFAAYDGANGVDTLAWLGSGEPGETVARRRRLITALRLDRMPAYEPAGRWFRGPRDGWLETLDRLEDVGERGGRGGLLLSLGPLELPWARAQELRDALLDIRESGRPVTVYLHQDATTTAYYVASAAEHIWMHPSASLHLTGPSTELVHARGLLDALGIEVQVVRRSEYKSAAENLERYRPSAENLEQQQAWLDDLFAELLDAVGDGRRRDAGEVEAWVDGGPWTAREAQRLGMVDGLAYPDQLPRELQVRYGHGLRVVNLAHVRQPRSAWAPPAQVAIVYVDGAIVAQDPGLSGLFGNAGAVATRITDQLRQAANDPVIRAVVLRIDSPGGSHFASDEIWRAVRAVRQAGKPVVTSMGAVAASGGYYIASASDAIFAEPTTLTGSIGVLSMKVSGAPLLDRWGVQTTTLTRGRSGGDTAARPWDPIQRARIDTLVGEAYAQFKQRVADGRDLSAEQVERIARGRIWSGSRAVDVGLVDELGGLHDAIAHARQLAGLPGSALARWVTLSHSRRQPTWPLRLLPAWNTTMHDTLPRLLADSTVGPWVQQLAWMANVSTSTERLWMIEPWSLGIPPN